MNTRFQVAGGSHLGRVRAHNDDYFCIGRLVEQAGVMALDFESSSRFFNDYGLLCAVADGMGGYEGGALASRTVLETLSALFYARQHRGMNAGELGAQIERDLESVQKVLTATLQREGVPHAGTTLAGSAFLPSGVAVLFHCGDSRVMRANGGYVRVLTTDHTPLAAEVAAGRLEEARAASSPLASKISRALGAEGDSRVEINPDFTWEADETYLLCSDGFHGLGRGLTLPTLRDRLCHFEDTSTRESVAALVEEAVELDGHDNITLVQIKISMLEDV